MYSKLFASLYQGTLRGCSDEILVFTNLLAHSDQFGFVDKHTRAIAEETGLPRERVEAAIKNLMAPDPESRSPEMDGRRIVLMDEHRAWGWKIVNYGKYRAIRSEDDRREQNRQAQARFRNKTVSKVSKVSRRQPPSAQGEGEGEGEESIPTPSPGKPDVNTLVSLGVPLQAAKDWMEVRKAKRAPLTETVLNELKREAGKAGIPVAQAVTICARRGWQGFKSSWNWQDGIAQTAERKVAL